MIYLQIPDNMKLDNKNGKDILVSLENLTDEIPLQDMVKTFLRNPYDVRTLAEKHRITFYKKLPIQTVPGAILCYQPKRNGVEPSEACWITTFNQISRKKHPNTQYGTFWEQTCVLSFEKRKQVQERRTEQKLNRRKVGDSPNTN